VDIPLGEGVAELGGLRIVGIEHKTNRRKDDQARGRAGRQGQPGSSVFYVSPSDEVFSFLPARRLRALAGALGADRIEQPAFALRRAWESAVRDAQKRAELAGETDRRTTTKLDGVIQLQRQQIRRARSELLAAADLRERIESWAHEELDRRLGEARGPIDLERARRALMPFPWVLESGFTRADLHAELDAAMARAQRETQQERGEDDAAFNQYLRDMTLFNLDQAWLDHLLEQEQLRRLAYLDAYGERDPYVEHAKRASRAFIAVGEAVKKTVAERYLHHITTR
jgi:preprotein translocase subunit SecA